MQEKPDFWDNVEPGLEKPDWLYAWFSERKIGARVVDQFGAEPVRWVFDAKDGEVDAIAMPLTSKGEVVNRVLYARKGVGTTLEKPKIAAVFNGAAFTCGDVIVWCSGELDVMALAEVGVIGGVSSTRLDALGAHADVISATAKIVLAFRDDKTGLVQREEMARRLGRHRVWVASASAFDVLTADGPEAVLSLARDATPYPIEGIHRVKAGTLARLRSMPPPGVMTTGTAATDAILKIPMEGRLIVITGLPNHGKALALDTIVPTPTGWTTMGALTDGDEVYAQDGTITHVVKAHPVMNDRICYRLRLSDGSTFDCDGGHLWLTRTEKARSSEWVQRKKRNGREDTLPNGTDQRHKMTLPSAVSTEEIFETLTVPDGGMRVRLNHSVPTALALAGGGAWPVAIKPYTLGAWLGDGSSQSAGFTSADPDVPRQIELDGYEVRKNSSELGWHIQGLLGQLRDANLIQNKHLPVDCLRASYSDRLALLQGLMDTDGHAGADGTAEFCTIRQNMAISVAELVRTMGVRASLYTGRATLRGKDCGQKFRVCFVPTFPAFRLARKLQWPPRCVNPGQRSKWRKIVSVEPIASIPVRCITVAHPDGLYLVGEQFTPTHNTNWTRFVMVHTASVHNRKWCVFSPESQPWEQFASECAEAYCGKPFYEMDRVPSMTNADIAEAEAFLSDKVTLLVCDAEGDAPTLDWLLERARACVLRDGTTDVLLDPWNEVDHERGAMTETDFIGKCLQRLKAFALRHGCNVWIVAHPAKPHPAKGNEKRLPPGPYDIAGSSHWANRTDLGLTIHSPGLGLANLIVWKSRMRRWAARDTVAVMEFDKMCGRYSTPRSPANDAGIDDDLLRGNWR